MIVEPAQGEEFMASALEAGEIADAPFSAPSAATENRSAATVTRRVLVVGVGNVLQGDDGFGVEVAHRLMRADLPPGVTVLETGIGGMSLVQELFAGYSALLVVDAVDRGGEPGTTYLLEAEVPSLSSMSEEQQQDLLADMHLATPSRAFILAKSLGVLPPLVYIFGCQPHHIDELEIGLSEPVAAAVEPSVERLLREIYLLMSAPITIQRRARQTINGDD